MINLNNNDTTTKDPMQSGGMASGTSTGMGDDTTASVGSTPSTGMGGVSADTTGMSKPATPVPPPGVEVKTTEETPTATEPTMGATADESTTPMTETTSTDNAMGSTTPTAASTTTGDDSATGGAWAMVFPNSLFPT